MRSQSVQINGKKITFKPPARSTGGMVPVKKSYRNISGLKSPDWVRDAILYEIYVRNFSGSGDFAGVIERLPELKELGVNTLWLMPVHPIGVKERKGKLGSPYAIKDYFGLNPEYGSEDDFRRLVTESHKSGMRIILDLVINHSANDHIMINEKIHWWQRDRQGYPVRRVSFWSDVVDFNYQSCDLWNYLVDMMKYWVEKFDIDGFRCDVAGMVPPEFWQYAIPQVKNVKPDLFFLAEWEDPELHLNAFHATYNWTFYFKILDVAQGKCSADEMLNAFLFKYHTFPQNSVRLNFIENHDEKRAMKLFGKQKQRLFSSLIFMLPGLPLIYNGQEAGYSSFLSLFNRRPMRWRNVDREVYRHYRDLIALRKRIPALRAGTVAKIDLQVPEQVIGFFRKQGNNFALCLFNFSDQSATINTEIPDKFGWAVLSSYPDSVAYTVKENRLSVALHPRQYFVLWCE
ncbi:MAG TPA: DUF3459 domain-containing protein [Bacteroidetes bacterium]|nr:DUF3459 domain-containing protein [Bacteroidota bacterium]